MKSLGGPHAARGPRVGQHWHRLKFLKPNLVPTVLQLTTIFHKVYSVLLYRGHSVYIEREIERDIQTDRRTEKYTEAG